MTLFMRYALVTIAVFYGHNSASAFEMDRGIGFEHGRDIEDWVDTKASRDASAGGYAAYTNNARAFNPSTLAAAQGNAITIQTDPGSHVVLNATQINTGNQTAEVNLKSISNKKYTNVDIVDTIGDAADNRDVMSAY